LCQLQGLTHNWTNCQDS